MAVSFVREVRDAYERLLAEPPERHQELAPAFGQHFTDALARRILPGVDADRVIAAVLPRYEHLMNIAAAALNPQPADSAAAS